MKPIAIQPQLVTQVFEAIRDAICEGRIAAGERLNQDALAERLGVSRQPVVQAIQLLKAHGFVRDTGRRRVEVVPLAPEQVHGLYMVRAALDAVAAREAARHDSAGAAARGKAIIAAGRRACRSGSVRDMISADMDFHTLIYDLSGVPAIEETLSPHWYHLRRIMATAMSGARPRDEVWDEHEAIFQAVLEGDGRRAEKLARDHAEHASTALVARLENTPEPSQSRAGRVSARPGRSKSA